MQVDEVLKACEVQQDGHDLIFMRHESETMGCCSTRFQAYRCESADLSLAWKTNLDCSAVGRNLIAYVLYQHRVAHTAIHVDTQF